MDRRQFLRAALSLAPALVVVPPAVSYFLAPRGGWPAWQRYSGYGFVGWGERHNRMTATECLERMKAKFAELAANPPLVMWGDHVVEASFDLSTFGSSVLRVTPGAVLRVPPHKWHTPEVARA